ncbi:PLAC8 protein, partial [Lophotis ruficrista]|nr:PLAC8 protein [Lophotis ruficrista]
CGAFCFSCVECWVSTDMDECCLSSPSVATRTLYCTGYNMLGSCDCTPTMCCPMCVPRQLKRDINQRKDGPVL